MKTGRMLQMILGVMAIVSIVFMLRSEGTSEEKR